MIKAAIMHKGYALIDILQPCVTFNRVNTYQWYKERVYKLGDDYDPTDYMAAMEKANEWGHRIPIGIIYKEEKKTFRERLALTDQEGLVGKAFNPADYAFLLDEFR